MTIVALAVTQVAAAIAIGDILALLIHQLAHRQWGASLVQVVFLVIVAYLVYGACVYALARLGYLRRLRHHVPTSAEDLQVVYTEACPPLLSALVPSYMEEPGVVMRTLLCTALQEYPRRRVVLLIDDPPSPRHPADAARLEEARALCRRVDTLLAEPRTLGQSALEAFLERQAVGERIGAGEYVLLAQLYADVATWFETQAAGYVTADHADRLFVELTFSGPARECRAESTRFRTLGREGRSPARPEDVLAAYVRMATRFAAEITSFERKRYDNLSHAANKAMNLNSYIALLGGSFREARREGRSLLEPAALDDADLTVPASEFLLIVDADSVITPDYALRLLHLMRQPGNERLAVAQTPYNAFPDAPGTVERIAGATTDIQYLLHEGFTAYGATYWVGANAVVRTAALADIATSRLERGYPVTRFVQDRTVIEDTESTVDLLARGWRLHSYPDRLAYSETPPDFGSLLIQRRRWANGGLIILPKLLRVLLRGGLRSGAALQPLIMVHYLTSLAAVNLGLMVVLAFSFEDSIRNAWLPVAAAPYYVLYARDLRLNGYRLTDLLRVYAINLVLIPVHLVGVFSSLQQAITGTKASFERTPKIRGRTGVPGVYLAATLGILAQWTVGVLHDLSVGRPVHALLTTMNIGFLVYGIVTYLGLAHSLEDLWASIPRRRVHVWRTRSTSELPHSAP